MAIKCDETQNTINANTFFMALKFKLVVNFCVCNKDLH